MKKNKKALLITVISMIILFIIYTLLVKYYDVKGVGPDNTKVGFSALNITFYNQFPYNETLYKITKYLGIIPFFIIAFYGYIGLKQLIKKKSLAKVDKKLIYLGLFYVLVGIVYVLFEIFAVNYRPVILEGGLEVSYPSSHTILAITICLSAVIISKYFIKNKKLLKTFNVSCIVLMSVIVLGRLFSGVHWFSDIIGGIIISTTLVYIYYYSIFNYMKKNN